MKKAARGRDLARELIARAAGDATILQKTLGRAAALAIVAASDEAGERFLRVKRDALADVGIALEPAWLDRASTTAEALARVREFNMRDDVDAIFIQFPLPPQIDAGAVADKIIVEKDIDCSSQRAFELFTTGNTPFTPVAPQAALDLLVDRFGTLAGRHIAIAGDDEFARALELLLIRSGAVTDAESAQADALVVVQDWPDTSAPVVLDAGYYLPPRPHGWIPERLQDRIAVYLTQYGNVGPLTIAHLFEETVRAALMHLRGTHIAVPPRSDHNTHA